MKTIRIMMIAFAAICFFATAEAQVLVHAAVGAPPPRHVIVQHRPPHHRRGPHMHAPHRHARHHHGPVRMHRR